MEGIQDRKLIEFECQALFRAKQYKSCELVTSLALSKVQAEANALGCSANIELFVAILEEILGDCADALGNFEEAIHFYRPAALRRYMLHSKDSAQISSSRDLTQQDFRSTAVTSDDVATNSEQVETVLIESEQEEKSSQAKTSDLPLQVDNAHPNHRYNTRRRKKIQESQHQENDRELNVIDSNRTAKINNEALESVEVKFQRAATKNSSLEYNVPINSVKTARFRPSASLRTKSCAVALSSAEANLRLKESRCHAKLGRVNLAISSLERISHEFKNFAVYMELGKLYIACSRKSDARLMFIEVLRRMPSCVEAIEACFILGSSRDQVVNVVEEGIKNRSSAYNTIKLSNGNPSISMESSFPIAKIIEAAFAAAKYDYISALKFYQKIALEYPRNAHVLVKIAMLQLKLVDYKSAERTFEEVRRLDKHMIDGMDQYAFVIYQRGERSKLNKLANDLLNLKDDRSETWTSLALLSKLNGDKEKCLTYLSKAARLDQNNGFICKLQGKLYLEAGKHQHAAMSYFKATEMSRDLDCFEGLVDVYLNAGKFKEAIIAAKNALQMAPNNARALTLVGVALAKGATTKEAQERAKRTLTKALSLDSSALRPLLALVNIHIKESECDSCVDLLSKGMESLRTNDQDLPLLHTKLGNVFALKKDFTNAITNFHAALALNPNYSAAHSGLEKVEKLMKGGVYDNGDSFTVESLD